MWLVIENCTLNLRLSKKEEAINHVNWLCLLITEKMEGKKTRESSELMADYVDVTCRLNVTVACRFKVKTAWVYFVIISYGVTFTHNGKGWVIILVKTGITAINYTNIYNWHQKLLFNHNQWDKVWYYVICYYYEANAQGQIVHISVCANG